MFIVYFKKFTMYLINAHRVFSNVFTVYFKLFMYVQYNIFINENKRKN